MLKGATCITVSGPCVVYVFRNAGYELWHQCVASKAGRCALTDRPYLKGERLFRPQRGSPTWWPGERIIADALAPGAIHRIPVIHPTNGMLTSAVR